MKDVRSQPRPYKSMRAVGVMQKPRLEGDKSVRSQIDRLLDLAVLEIPEMDVLAVFPARHILQIESGHESVGRGPFGRNHHVVAGLIPEVVVILHLAEILFPAADNLEILGQMQKTARPVAIGIAQHRHDDFRAQTVHRMRRGKVGPGLDLVPVNGLVKHRLARVGGSIHDIEIRGADAGNNQILALHASVVMTG